jgi:hypothetical protein
MIQAKLFIIGQEIELLWTDMNYYRNIKVNGKPATDILGGLITLCFATTKDTDLVLRWLTKESEDDTWEEVDKMEEGKVCFYDNGFDYPPTKTYKFSDAHLVYFKETFNTLGEEPLQTILTISPAIQNYSVDFLKRWNVSWVPPSERIAYKPIEVERDEVIDCYLTDLENNETSNVSFEQEVYLVVKTKNMIGKIKDIDLKNLKHTFEYNGELLENNTLKSFNIEADLQKVKLKVIKPQKPFVELED